MAAAINNNDQSRSKDTEESKGERAGSLYLEQGRMTNQVGRSSTDTEHEDYERSNSDVLNKVLGG